MKRILCIDGGGMRGFIPASLLVELERRTGRRCAELFDAIWGTSIGGILAALLGSGLPASEAIQFFTADGPEIFKKSLRTATSLGGLLRPKYSGAVIEAVLRRRFAGLEPRTRIGMPTFDLVTQSPYFFKFAPFVPGDLWQAARATSSAQIYFPAFELDEHVFWDGGNVANNPAVCAYADAVRDRRHSDGRVLLLSLGCGAGGQSQSKVQSPKSKVQSQPAARGLINAGAIRNGLATVTTLFEADSAEVDYQMQQFLGGNYFRLQPTLAAPLPLDDASPTALLNLKDAAANALREHGHRLDKFMERI